MLAAIETYLESLPPERQAPMRRLHAVIQANIPAGFAAVCAGSPAWVVPLSRYPEGYHCNPATPLPFISIASQKNYIALYHFGLYADPELLQWFVAAYPRHSERRLDMGKSCVRFKHVDQIPFPLIAELAGKRTVAQWLETYTRALATTARGRR